ncbi:hypothetical protein [Paenibacillus sp. UNC451MF]|uniref:hypothetical protein n=1 Tax=Paenibacillus sp. UNC451MF TaxID=1449063 RepID=UPI0012DFB794|nr:hypothetical protein [Paenibacillus sp. UNC451MF]
MNRCSKCGRPLEKGLTGKCSYCKTKVGNDSGKIGAIIVAAAPIIYKIVKMVLKNRKK